MLSKKMLGASWLTLMLIVLHLSQLIGAGMARSSDTSDYNQMMAAARNYVKAHSAPGIMFNLKLLKQVNNYALLEARPKGKWANQAEPAGVILQKIGGKWVPQTMGTDFSEWETRVPELFKQ